MPEQKERASLIERVAKRIWFETVEAQGYPNGMPTWGEMNDANKQMIMQIARGAIEAMREPTADMLRKGWESGLWALDDGEKEAATVWQAMIDEALK